MKGSDPQRLDGLCYRPWTADDIPTLSRLATDLYRHIEAVDPVWRTAPPAHDYLNRHLLDLFHARHATTYLAHRGHEIVGFITGTVIQRPPLILPRKDGLVDNAYVKAPWRRRGVGTQLLDLLLDWFRRQGIQEVRIHYQASNEGAVAFWERAGFRTWTIQGHMWLAKGGH